MTDYLPGLHTGYIELIVALLASARQAWDIIDQYGADEPTEAAS